MALRSIRTEHGLEGGELEGSLPDRSALVAEDLITLGAVQHEWGHYQEAEQYHRQALDITQSFYGQSHYKTAAGLTLVGRTLIFRRQRYEAVKLWIPWL